MISFSRYRVIQAKVSVAVSVTVKKV
jgi:hypothetical protein